MANKSAYNHRNYSVRGMVTKRRKKSMHAKSGDSSTYKASKWVSYCPECPRSHLTPQKDIKVYGPFKRREQVVSCSNGHVFTTR